MEAKIFKISDTTRVTGQLYRMELEGSFAANPVPGQFIHIKADDRLFLRRPFSIAGYKNSFFTIIFRVVGEGTKIMSAMKKGTQLSVIGPLGNGFPVKKTWKKVFLAGGGTGIAPMVFLSDRLPSGNAGAVFFYGAKSVDDIAFSALPRGVACVFTTEDGSYGYKGTVNRGIEDHIKKNGPPDVIYGGGPYGMLKKLGELSEKYGIPAFVSMENRMACGTGVCYGCVTKIKSGSGWEYKRVCKDGPVFSTREILWE
jgi:dihydroorotate dehydrogenase electron transfer subunit